MFYLILQIYNLFIKQLQQSALKALAKRIKINIAVVKLIFAFKKKKNLMNLFYDLRIDRNRRHRFAEKT